MNTKEKLLAVATLMVNEPEEITEVHKSDSEYYFRFAGFVFSIIHRASPSEFGEYSIYMYPKWYGAVTDLIDAMDIGEVGETQYVSFDATEMPTESKKVFIQLYNTIDRRHQGVESILDNILSR